MNVFKELNESFEKWHQQELGSFALETKVLKLLEYQEDQIKELRDLLVRVDNYYIEENGLNLDIKQALENSA